MAENKKIDTNLFSKTTKTPKKKEPKSDLVESRGVGLKLSEWAIIDDLARQLSTGLAPVTYYDVMQHIAREYLKSIERGDIKLETTQAKKLPST